MEKTTTTRTATDEIQAAGEAGRKAMLAAIEATADMSAQFDRLLRAQLGYMTSAGKDTADFVATSCEGAMKAREAFRRAGVELAEQTFAAAARR